MNYNPKNETDDSLSLKELCDELSISTATGRNWLKLGKIVPTHTQNKAPYFSMEYVKKIKHALHSGGNQALKSRRNKKFVSGNSLYNSYVSEDCKNISTLQKLLALITDYEIEPDSSTISLLVADCALQLFQKGHLLSFLKHEATLGEYDSLLRDLIQDEKKAIDFCNAYPLLFSLEYIYEPCEDILGLLYISCKNIGSRKATGSYYTPTKVVKKLIQKLEIKEKNRILDPCCGTGNFLLQLPDSIPFACVYGNDTDVISIRIARLNVALKFHVPCDMIYEHITNLDYLTQYKKDLFHFIIGNPPWGYAFSEEEKKSLRPLFFSASGKNIESYDVFIEQALKHLAPNGHVSFVLPEAILNVKAHADIREVLLQSCSIKNLMFLGNAFDGVQCPCIILDMENTKAPFSTVGMVVQTGDKEFSIQTNRQVTAKNFSFTTSDEEYQVLQKIKAVKNASYLLNHADFGLGIVTGNNKKFITTEKTAENEMILKGADISKYHINPTQNYITFQPEKFQQVAPVELYRAPEKLLYRFISSQLVFAYDDKQTLSLNSCNIVIPKLDDMDIKYILAILNSSVAQFLYQKEFHSVKVLRAHIESIPIPRVDTATQKKIIKITDKLIAGLEMSQAKKVYEELDELIFEVYHLTDSEKEVIRKAI